MSMTIAPEQIDRIIWNQHQDPFEVLGPHTIEQNGKTVWVVRSYLPNADAVWVRLHWASSSAPPRRFCHSGLLYEALTLQSGLDADSI